MYSSPGFPRDLYSPFTITHVPNFHPLLLVCLHVSTCLIFYCSLCLFPGKLRESDTLSENEKIHKGFQNLIMAPQPIIESKYEVFK